MSSLRKFAAVMGISVIAVFSSLASAGVASAAEIGTVWNNATLPDDIVGLDAIAYGDGVFVGINAGGDILRSTDGKSWTSIENDGGTWTYVIFGESTFVAIGNNRSAFSTDGGLTFSNAADMVDGRGEDTFYAGAYGDGLFIALEGGDCNGHTAVSEDGQTWEAGPDLQNAYCAIGAAYGSGVFTATSDSGTIDYSSDPTDQWHAANITGHTPGGAFSQVAYNGTQFLTLMTEDTGSGNVTYVYTSTDGITWNGVATTGLGINNFFGLGWDGAGWLAGANWDGVGIHRSTDGVNWVAVDSSETQWWSFALGNGIVTAGGQPGDPGTAPNLDPAIAVGWSEASQDTLPNTGQDSRGFASVAMVASFMVALGAAAVYRVRTR